MSRPPAMTTSRLTRWVWAALVCLGPFELLAWALPAGPTQLTTSEALAMAALATGALELWRRTGAVGWRATLRPARQPAMLALAVFGALPVLSAAWAPDARFAVFKFGLRAAAAVGLGWTAALLSADRRFMRALRRGLVLGLALQGLIAIGERANGPWLEPFLTLFRDEPTWMLGERRLSTVFYHANTLAAYLELTAPFTVVGAVLAWRRRSPTVALLAVIAAGMLSLTYSRAGLLAGVLGAGVLTASAWRRPGRRDLAIAAASWAALVVALFAGNADMRARLGLENRAYDVAYTFGARCVGEPGETVEVPVRIDNRGGWPLSDRHAPASLAWQRWDGDGERVGDRVWLALPDIGGDSHVEVVTQVQMPEVPGRFAAVFDISRHEVIWISATGAVTGHLDCYATGDAKRRARIARGDEALPQTAPPPPEPYRYRPVELHRPHYWRAAFELIAERPMLGHGADRFRTVYRDHVPLEAWEPRARAHSVLLETAVDLGLLGLFVLSVFGALLFAKVVAVVRSRRASPEQMAGAAAVVGFALHGLVDYFLAYTQIYVIAWPIVGVLLGGGGAEDDDDGDHGRGHDENDKNEKNNDEVAGSVRPAAGDAA